jgi:hypothetical protein
VAESVHYVRRAPRADVGPSAVPSHRSHQHRLPDDAVASDVGSTKGVSRFRQRSS